MIDDPELRDIFKAECEEHIRSIEKGLLQVEKDGANRKILKDILREAHNLKGAARMVQAGGIEAVAHRMEDIFSAAEEGSCSITPEVIDQLNKGLDALGDLVDKAVTGRHSDLDLEEILLKLSSAAGGKEARMEKPSELEEEKQVKPGHPPKGGSGSGESEVQAATAEEYSIETVRIRTSRLDSLMTLIGEFMVTKTHINHAFTLIEDLMTEWEEISRSIPEGGNGTGEHDLSGTIREINKRIECIRNLKHEDITRLDYIGGSLEEEVMGLRLLPLSMIFKLYPRMVRDISREESKDVSLIMEGGDISADKRILEAMKDPIMHMIRNAIGHGIEGREERKSAGKEAAGRLTVRAYRSESDILLEVEDDGAGIDMDLVRKTAVAKKIATEDEVSKMVPSTLMKLIFSAGYSTSALVTDVSGRGVGLDVVNKNVEMLKGNVTVESEKGKGTLFRVTLPIMLATTRVILVSTGEYLFAIPVEFIESCCFISEDEVFSLERSETVTYKGESLSVARLSRVLEIEDAGKEQPETGLREGRLPCIIISVGNEMFGLLVHSLVDEQEIIIKDLGPILKRVRNISGTTILGTGEVCHILNPHDILKVIQKRRMPEEVQPDELTTVEKERKLILLVEDSITTRAQERRILVNAGYDVITAVDGLDGWQQLGKHDFDAVVTDVQMPNMDGWALTEKIKNDRRYRDLPVIVITVLASSKHRKKGLDAGADAYITKPSFNHHDFLAVLGRLV